jgi:hypothetical protein
VAFNLFHASFQRNTTIHRKDLLLPRAPSPRAVPRAAREKVAQREKAEAKEKEAQSLSKLAKERADHRKEKEAAREREAPSQ